MIVSAPQGNAPGTHPAEPVEQILLHHSAHLMVHGARVTSASRDWTWQVIQLQLGGSCADGLSHARINPRTGSLWHHLMCTCTFSREFRCLLPKCYVYRLYCIFMFKCRGVLEANCIFFSTDGSVNVSMHYLLTKGQSVQVLTQQCRLPLAIDVTAVYRFLYTGSVGEIQVLQYNWSHVIVGALPSDLLTISPLILSLYSIPLSR